MKPLLSKINWRLILVHFIALWLFFISFRIFAFFLDYRFMSDLDNLRIVQNSSFRLQVDLYRIAYAGYVGILIALLLSLMAVISRGWLWINSIISFTILFWLCEWGIISSRLIPYFYIQMDTKTMLMFYPPLAVVMLSFALVLFYSNPVAKFINKRSDKFIKKLSKRLKTTEPSQAQEEALTL